MPRRLATIAATLALALLIPLSPVAADTLGESGTYFEATTERLCANGLCTVEHFTIDLPKNGEPIACIELRHSDQELGIVYETESGCTDLDEPFDATISVSKAGFIVGMDRQRIRVYSDFNVGTSHVVLVRGTWSITSPAVRTAPSSTSVDSPEPGCTTFWSAKIRTVDVAGSLTVGSDPFTTFAFEGTAEDVTAKTRVRC